MPIRVVIATTVKMNASTTPVVNPIASTCNEASIRSGSTPLRIPSHQACAVSVNVGTSNWLSRWRA